MKGSACTSSEVDADHVKSERSGDEKETRTADWRQARVKNYFRESDLRLDNAELPLLSLTRSRGLIRHSEATSKLAAAEDHSKYKVCHAGWLVMNRMQAWSGMFAVATESGIVSPDYSVFRMSDAEQSVAFFECLFKSPPLVEQFASRSKGIGSGFNRLYTPEFGSIPIMVPDPSEQAQIVRFIRHLDHRVNRLIKAKRRLIELLNEQKQAIIHQAVTRGLDPAVPLKPSGIDWLGDMPAHWTLLRLRHLVSEQLSYGANEAGELTDESLPRYIRITDFSQDGSLRSETFRSLPQEKAKNYMVSPGDVLLARSGATVGKAFLVPEGTGEACHAGYLIKAKANRELIHPQYLFAFTQSRAYFDWKEATFNIATIQNIGADKYANLHVPTPGLDEQTAILKAIQLESEPINEATSKLRAELDLIHEYRTRLVTDVVTGQLDVRHLDLPEVEDGLLETIEPGIDEDEGAGDDEDLESVDA